MRCFVNICTALASVLLVVGCGGEADRAERAPASVQVAAKGAPNIVVVMTDDQAIDTMQAMPKTIRIFDDRGTTFESAVASFPLCCPSRATFLTGLYAHNHGVVDNSAPAGGLGKLSQKDTLPVWLDQAGYRTAFVGKYLNGYGKENLGGSEYVPPGWDQWFGLTAETKKAAFEFDLNRNGTITKVNGGARTYKTDVLSRIGARTIEESSKRQAPLFLWLATSAPHADPDLEGSDRNPAPAPRHRGAFEDAHVPSGLAYDERNVSDKPGFVKELPRLDAKTEKLIDLTYRSQLESLLAVDDLVANLVGTLRRTGELKNTLFVFTSDNGFLHGQHRIDSGKAKMYEESILVPLMVMGPG
ncbi:MAG TPA: sulfatase, partial [Solirubrobacterales bacterium]|nr:sulfatase [Solirubrobacterales bacterium]